MPADALVRAQAAIAEGDWRADSQAKEWAGYAIAKALDLDSGSERDKARVKRLLGDWLKAGAFKVVDMLDATSRMRKFIQVGKGDGAAKPSRRHSTDPQDEFKPI